MTRLIPLALLLATASVEASDQKDRFEKMGWTKIRPLESPEAVDKKTGSQEPVSLLVVENPEVERANYLVAGQVRFSDVAGSAYLEMWTVYDDDRRYFSRTLGDTGPMAKMSGNSDWRSFMLPFHGDAEQQPVQLEINAILPGGGSMEFRNVALYEAHQPRSPGWWDHRTGGIIGAVFGVSCGLLGTIGRVLGERGKARGFVCGLVIAGIVVGFLLLITGFVAVAKGQPREVTSTLFLMGGLLATLCGLYFPKIRKNYIEHELRQISAAG
ncbi:MAG: hypothetical protein AAGA58_13605 [Verrucomicrobiota bacterium]